MLPTVELVRIALMDEYPMISPAMSAQTVLDEIYLGFDDNPVLQDTRYIAWPDVMESLTILTNGYNDA